MIRLAGTRQLFYDVLLSSDEVSIIWSIFSFVGQSVVPEKTLAIDIPEKNEGDNCCIHLATYQEESEHQ